MYWYYTQDDQWADLELANEYIAEFETDGCTWSLNCLEKGCRWSIIYSFSGITMLLLAANSMVQAVGSYRYRMRALGAVCASMLCCVNLAAIITTGVFRFNLMGKLAALSQLDNKYEGLTQGETDIVFKQGGETYESDGKLILGLWIIQIVFLCSNMGFTGYASKPPSELSDNQATMVTPEHQLLIHDD